MLIFFTFSVEFGEPFEKQNWINWDLRIIIRYVDSKTIKFTRIRFKEIICTIILLKIYNLKKNNLGKSNLL